MLLCPRHRPSFRPSYLLLTLLLLVAASPLQAWWDGGHKVSAYLAYDALTPPEREWVMTLIKQNPTYQQLFAEKIIAELPADADPETVQRWHFGQASVWADLVRNSSGYTDAKTISASYSLPERHYTDLPVFITPNARAQLQAVDLPPLTAWAPGQQEPEVKLNSMQAFAKIFAEVPDPKLPIATRSIELLWLFHLVGDTHQPCHCAQLFDPEKLPAGDRGANGIMIFGLKNRAPGMYSDVLHAFWDSFFNGATNTHADILSRTRSLQAKTHLMQAAQSATTERDPVAWLKEGHALAESTVYPPALRERIQQSRVEIVTKNSRSQGTRTEHIVMVSMPTTALDDYERNARAAADAQMLKAGLRLAGSIRHLHQASQSPTQ
jgi:hypothetical protein